MRKICYIIVCSLFLFSCAKEEKKEDCDILKYGAFDVYQKGQKVGSFYRKDSLQVETYVGKKITGLTKVKQVDKCQYVLRSYWPKKNIDTMNFTVNYTVKSKEEINYELRPTYLKTERKLRGKIVKVSDTIKADILKKFGNL